MAKKTNCIVNGIPKYRLRTKINGEFKNFYGDSVKHANQLKDEYLNSISPIHEDDSFEEKYEKWFFNVYKPTLAPSSFSTYSSCWRIHLKSQKFVKKKFLKVESLDLQIALNSITNLYMKNRSYQLLFSFYKYYLKQPNRLITQNPLETVTIPKYTPNKSKKLFLSKIEMTKLMKSFESDYKLFIYVFAAHTGLRQGELLALRVSDVNFENMTVSVTKSVKYINVDGTMQFYVKGPKTESGYRSIPIFPDLIDPLKKQIALIKSNHLKLGVKYKPEDALLFPNTRLTFQKSNHLLDAWKKVQRELSIFDEEITFHVLRHTFCSMLCVANVPLRTAADLMGHSGIDMVAEIYAHVDIEYMRQAINKIGDYYSKID